MPKAITDNELRKISIEIKRLGPNSEFGWDAICLLSEKILGYRPTRQALSRKLILKKAYEDKGKELKALARKVGGLTRETKLNSALRNEKLLAENKALLDQLTEQAEVINRIIYNATRLGMKKGQLLATLPKIYK